MNELINFLVNFRNRYIGRSIYFFEYDGTIAKGVGRRVGNSNVWRATVHSVFWFDLSIGTTYFEDLGGGETKLISAPCYVVECSRSLEYLLQKDMSKYKSKFSRNFYCRDYANG